MTWPSRVRSPYSVATALIMGLFLAGTAQMAAGADTKPDGVRDANPEQVVQAQLEAYNRHDLEAFLNTYSPEIKLYDFPDKESASGLEAMRERYGKLFKRDPNLKVRIVTRIVQGDRVIDHEEVNLGSRQFRVVAIYQVKGDKITAVWFLK